MSPGLGGKNKAILISIGWFFVAIYFMLTVGGYNVGMFNFLFNFSLISNLMFYLTLSVGWERLSLFTIFFFKDVATVLRIDFSVYFLMIGVSIGILAGIYIALKTQSKKEDQKSK